MTDTLPELALRISTERAAVHLPHAHHLLAMLAVTSELAGKAMKDRAADDQLRLALECIRQQLDGIEEDLSMVLSDYAERRDPIRGVADEIMACVAAAEPIAATAQPV